MHPSTRQLLTFFEYGHLPPMLQGVSKPFAELAGTIAAGPENQETTVALRKLLEAKDCAVRAYVCQFPAAAFKPGTAIEVDGDAPGAAPLGDVRV